MVFRPRLHKIQLQENDSDEGEDDAHQEEDAHAGDEGVSGVAGQLHLDAVDVSLDVGDLGSLVSARPLVVFYVITIIPFIIFIFGSFRGWHFHRLAC